MLKEQVNSLFYTTAERGRLTDLKGDIKVSTIKTVLPSEEWKDSICSLFRLFAVLRILTYQIIYREDIGK